MHAYEIFYGKKWVLILPTIVFVVTIDTAAKNKNKHKQTNKGNETKLAKKN